MQAIARLSAFVGETFAFWVLLFAVLAFYLPNQFSWIAPYIVPSPLSRPLWPSVTNKSRLPG